MLALALLVLTLVVPRTAMAMHEVGHPRLATPAAAHVHHGHHVHAHDAKSAGTAVQEGDDDAGGGKDKGDAVLLVHEHPPSPGAALPDAGIALDMPARGRPRNAILLKHGSPYEVRPPVLKLRDGTLPPVVTIPEQSVDESAKALIQDSLTQADRFLSEGKPRQEVQEILWLLETVSTAFEGLAFGQGTVEGKYFNDIIRDLRKHNDGTLLAQAGAWMKALHGFPSSPSGGGVRHGTQLSGKSELKLHEATLYCNLTRSHIGYLLAELQEHA